MRATDCAPNRFRSSDDSVSIRLRLAALFTLAVIVMMSIGGYVYIEQLRSGLEDSLDQSLGARAATIAAASATDPSARLPNGNGGYAQIYSRAGQILDSSVSLTGDRLLGRAQVQSLTRGGTVHENQSVRVHGASGDLDVKSLRIYATRARGSGRIVAVADERELVDDALAQSQRQVVIFAGIVIILAGPGSWLLARAALRPVEQMRSRVARLDAADAGSGVPVPATKDEIARLGRTFNDLLARVHAALERERAFVADAGHELRTPLTVLKGEFELAQRPGRTREALLETVGIAAEETDRLVRLTEHLLGLARTGRVNQHPLNMADVARTAIATIAPSATSRGVSMTMQDQIGGLVDGDADRLRQAIDNLLSNAVRYSPAGKTVSTRLAMVGNDAVIEVTDEGPGFPREFLAAAFDRFTRADDARGRSEGGNGLGLAVVASIMSAHGGTATAANGPHGGAVLTLRWPQQTHDDEETAESDTATPAP